MKRLMFIFSMIFYIFSCNSTTPECNPPDVKYQDNEVIFTNNEYAKAEILIYYAVSTENDTLLPRLDDMKAGQDQFTLRKGKSKAVTMYKQPIQLIDYTCTTYDSKGEKIGFTRAVKRF